MLKNVENEQFMQFFRLTWMSLPLYIYIISRTSLTLIVSSILILRFFNCKNDAATNSIESRSKAEQIRRKKDQQREMENQLQMQDLRRRI